MNHKKIKLQPDSGKIDNLAINEPTKIGKIYFLVFTSFIVF